MMAGLPDPPFGPTVVPSPPKLLFGDVKGMGKCDESQIMFFLPGRPSSYFEISFIALNGSETSFEA